MLSFDQNNAMTSFRSHPWLNPRRLFFWLWALPTGSIVAVLFLALWPGLQCRFGVPGDDEDSMWLGVIRSNGWSGRHLLIRLVCVDFTFNEIRPGRTYWGPKYGAFYVDFGKEVWVLGRSNTLSGTKNIPESIGWESRHYIVEIRRRLGP